MPNLGVLTEFFLINGSPHEHDLPAIEKACGKVQADQLAIFRQRPIADQPRLK
jgi:hypothetical protein